MDEEEFFQSLDTFVDVHDKRVSVCFSHYLCKSEKFVVNEVDTIL